MWECLLLGASESERAPGGPASVSERTVPLPGPLFTFKVDINFLRTTRCWLGLGLELELPILLFFLVVVVVFR